MNEVHISTVGGSSNVINLSSTPDVKKYVVRLTQSGVNAPVVSSEIVNDFGGIVFTRDNQGRYRGTLVGAFDDDKITVAMFNNQISQTQAGFDPVSNFQLDTTTSNDYFRIVTSELFDQAGLTAQRPIDDALRGQKIVIEQMTANQPTTAEEVFNIVLSKLDSNQVDIWNKIVVRFNSVVTEVSGATYRRTNSFGGSSKLIES